MLPCTGVGRLRCTLSVGVEHPAVIPKFFLSIAWSGHSSLSCPTPPLRVRARRQWQGERHPVSALQHLDRRAASVDGQKHNTRFEVKLGARIIMLR